MKKDLNSYYIKIFCNKEKTKYEYMKINMAIDFTFLPISEQMIDYNIHLNYNWKDCYLLP